MQATIEKPKAKRRGKGEGTIIFRDGRYHGVVSAGLDASGKRIRRWVSGKTRKAVTDEMTRLRSEALAGPLDKALPNDGCSVDCSLAGQHRGARQEAVSGDDDFAI